MARLVGDDLAELQKARWIPSMAKLAIKAGVRASDKVQQRIAAQNVLVQQLRKLKGMSDARGWRRQLFPHQRADLEYMKQVPLPSYLLAHQPGVGKTPEAIVWVDELLNARRSLVICPNSAKEQWADEIRRWDQRTPLITVVEGTIPEQVQQITTAQHGWVIAHWEALVHARIAFVQHPWNVVIADEAQLAQNRRAQRTKTLFKLRADNRMALSGHPFANDPGELWSILKFLYPDRYKSYWRYFYMFVDFYPEAFGKMKISGTKRPNLLKWELAPFTLRRLKRDVWKNLPPVARQRRVAYLDPSARREYDRLKKQFFVELEGREKKLPIINVLSRSTRLRQWLVDPGLIGSTKPSLKYPVVHELMEEYDGPPVIFTMFKQAGYRLMAYLKKTKKNRQLAMVSGDETTRSRRIIQKKFIAGDLHAVVMVIEASKYALNYGKFGYVIHLDLPWTARDFEQTEGRVDRPEEGTGIIIPTTSTRVIVKNSFEDRVMEPMINTKDADFGQVFTRDSLEDLLHVA